MKSIAVLITCHNRKAKTLACLTALYDCTLPQGYAMEVYLVDDGSSDGTAQAVKDNFPAVRIIQGNGKLYWNRGMRLAWETAANTKDYDFYLWLNDDTILVNTALDILFTKSIVIENTHILVGATSSINSMSTTYSGYLNYDTKLNPNGKWQNCDYFNGNIVLVPKIVFKKVGFLDLKFQHAFGDFDYGRRAKKEGIKLILANEYLGFCESNVVVPQWRNLDVPFIKRIKLLYDPLGNNPIQFFIIDKRHNGLLQAIIHFFTIHLRTLFPLIWDFKKK